MMTLRLENKVVLVTGASKGIGQALAIGAAREGADVIVNYCRDATGAEQTAAAVRALGRRALAIGADVGSVEQIRQMFARLRREFDRLDVLVNNAGITSWSSLQEATQEQWDEVFNVNTRGTFFCTQEAARWMHDLKLPGSIINVSTNCAALGVKNLAAYAASKAAINGLTRQLAIELAPHGIRVNAFAPGPTRVDRNLRDDPAYEAQWESVVPLGRTASPEEMVGTAVYLASDESSYVTGQVIYVDGGWTVQGRLPATTRAASLRPAHH